MTEVDIRRFCIQTLNRIHNRYGKGEIQKVTFDLFCDLEKKRTSGGTVIVYVPYTQTGGCTTAKYFYILHSDRSYVKFMGKVRKIAPTT